MGNDGWVRVSSDGWVGVGGPGGRGTLSGQYCLVVRMPHLVGSVHTPHHE